MTVLLIILSVLMLLFLWVILAPIELVVDTRVPVVHVRLVSIGIVSVLFRQDEFWLNVQIFFMQFNWRMEDFTKKKKEPLPKSARKKKINSAKVFSKMLRVLKGFRVKQFELRLNPSDYTVTGRLYPLNFIPLPAPYKLSVSLSEDAYLMMIIRTAPWRMAYALVRK
jgi:hypothetical protein